MSSVEFARPVMPSSLEPWLDGTTRDGEIVVETARGVGRLFLSGGKVAWVIADEGGERLSSALLRETSLSRASLRACYERCRRSGANFAEALVAQGDLDRATMRELLRRHHARQLERLLQPSAVLRVLFEPTVRTYASGFLFTLEELLEGERGVRASELCLRDENAPKSSHEKENERMSNINASLEEVMKLDGAIAAALVDWESGLTLGTISAGSGFDIELAASGNTSVVKAKMQVMRQLGIGGAIEDILITLGTQYHLIRPLSKTPSLFLYVAIDKVKGNLGLARHKVRVIEESLAL